MWKISTNLTLAFFLLCRHGFQMLTDMKCVRSGRVVVIVGAVGAAARTDFEITYFAPTYFEKN